MTVDELRQYYEHRYTTILEPLAKKIEDHIKGIIEGQPRIDRVSARAKSIQRFLDKAKKMENGSPKYADPLNQIQDQLGARIVTFYASDLESLDRLILDYLAPIEQKVIIPDSVSEFGYEGKHYILFIPEELLTPDIDRNNCPKFFELQVKTLFQHAWAEANHDLAYKPQSELTREHWRRLAFTAAQAWGADYIFNELAQILVT
jgi:putative GTP pyrophosphokinase